MYNMRYLYTLKYNKETVGLQYQDASYLLCFPLSKHAMMTRNSLRADKKNIFLTKYHDYIGVERKYKPIEVKEQNMDIHLYTTKGHYLHVGKDTPDEASLCSLYATPFEDLLMYPIFHNIGLVLPFEVMDETDKEWVFSTEIVKPLNNPHLFKYILS